MIYLDNAATSYPKPISVTRRVAEAMKKYSFNSGRGGYRESVRAAEKIFEVREHIAGMFGFTPENVVFTKNCTEALNVAIKGSVCDGDHVIISSLEHNSVSRVVQALYDAGTVDFDIARFSFEEDACAANFKSLMKPNTRAVICMHSSNVFGVRFPLQSIGKLCREQGIRFIVDAAQGAGADHISADDMNIDILCAPGHKSLYGPMGTGFLAVRKGVEVTPLLEGGTGTQSLLSKQPDELPERLESGTLNNAGIMALGEGVRFIETIGISAIKAHEIHLCKLLYDSLSQLKGVMLYTPSPDDAVMMPIISFNYQDYSSEAVAAYLAENRICVRAGYHCSYLAHRHFQTTDTGTVRISPGFFNTPHDIDVLINVLKKL